MLKSLSPNSLVGIDKESEKRIENALLPIAKGA